MKKATIRRIARKYGLTGNTEKFVEWFSKRFPNESDRIESYCAEWVGRFNTRRPEVYMDLTSKKMYEHIYGKLKKVV